MTTGAALENPIRFSLIGEHARFARRFGRAARYLADVALFAAVEAPDADALRDLAGLAEPGGLVAVQHVVPDSPLAPHWHFEQAIELVQMVCREPVLDPGSKNAYQFEELGKSDADQMPALAERTRPGPFTRRSVEPGCFLGLRERGRLIAMAIGASH